MSAEVAGIAFFSILVTLSAKTTGRNFFWNAQYFGYGKRVTGAYGGR
jgi:hypothetical protein